MKNLFKMSVFFIFYFVASAAHAEFANFSEYSSYIKKHSSIKKEQAGLIGACMVSYGAARDPGGRIPCFNVEELLDCLKEFGVNDVRYNGENVVTEKYILSKKLCLSVEEVTPRIRDFSEYYQFIWNLTDSTNRIELSRELISCMRNNSFDMKLPCSRVSGLILCMNKNPESAGITHKGVRIVTEDYIRTNKLCKNSEDILGVAALPSNQNVAQGNLPNLSGSWDNRVIFTQVEAEVMGRYSHQELPFFYGRIESIPSEPRSYKLILLDGFREKDEAKITENACNLVWQKRTDFRLQSNIWRADSCASRQ
jgi:hypothetical protein